MVNRSKITGRAASKEMPGRGKQSGPKEPKQATESQRKNMNESQTWITDIN